MAEYQELMQAISSAAEAIFASAKTEDDVCALEQVIYNMINDAARASMVDHESTQLDN